MSESEIKLLKTRVETFINRLKEDIYGESIPLEAVFAPSAEPVPYQERLNLAYRPVAEGDKWGEMWSSAWFHIQTPVPETMAGRELCLRIYLGGEILVFDETGAPCYGLSGASHFVASFRKERMVLPKCYQAGEIIDVWLEAAANHLFGVYQDEDPRMDTPHPLGQFEGTVTRLRLAVFHREVWDLYTDFTVLQGQMSYFAERGDYRYRRLLAVLNQAIDVYGYHPANAGQARAVTAIALTLPAAASALTTTAVGHAHIDVAWLWPMRESIRKAARTFASALAIMDQNPDYVFGASQAKLYAMVKEHYPELFERIKTRVREGRFEIQGGMWVEADCNMISGESMIRQFVHGKNFFMDEFGFDVKNLWLPDVFGYSANLPQIIRKSGCDYFLTQKISWSKINGFPHQTFYWTGVDGSSVLTHFPPEDTYNSLLESDRLLRAQDRFIEGGVLDEYITLYGVGDGGGGPNEDIVARGMRQHNLDGAPKVNFGRADRFFERLQKRVNSLELAEWRGELYLECHRGTFTTQAATKKGNRRCEEMLLAVEFLAAVGTMADYPAAELDRLWKTVLTNQFHDVLPGSSIHEVYQTASREYAEVLAGCQTLLEQSAARIFAAAPDRCVAVNSLGCDFYNILPLPQSWGVCGVADRDGNRLPCEVTDGRTYALVRLPSSGITTLCRTAAPAAAATVSETFDGVLQNEFIRYEFAADGRLLKLFDKVAQREIVSLPGNILTLYNDFPANLDAWEIESYYTREKHSNPTGLWRGRRDNALRHTLVFEYKIGQNSTMVQEITLPRHSRRLDFVNRVDWHEYRKMLRVAFPLALDSDYTTCDIQYAALRRPTVDNTPWDSAKFEIACLRYADLSEPDYGVALLNDCKYGYKVKNNTLDLCLLRSPKYPDFYADMGAHEFTYSLLPHPGTLSDSNVAAEAAQLNRMPLVADGRDAGKIQAAAKIESGAISLEVVKKAENSQARTLRVIETKGRHSTGTLIIPGAKKLTETNLLEWTHEADYPIADGRAELKLKPFEIKTFLLE